MEPEQSRSSPSTIGLGRAERGDICGWDRRSRSHEGAVQKTADDSRGVCLVSSLQGEAVAFGAGRSVSLWDGVSCKKDLAHRKYASPVAKGAKLESIWGVDRDDVYMTAANGRTYHFDGSSWTMQNPRKTVSALHGIAGIPEKSLRAVRLSAIQRRRRRGPM